MHDPWRSASESPHSVRRSQIWIGITVSSSQEQPTAIIISAVKLNLTSRMSVPYPQRVTTRRRRGHLPSPGSARLKLQQRAQVWNLLSEHSDDLIQRLLGDLRTQAKSQRAVRLLGRSPHRQQDMAGLKAPRGTGRPRRGADPAHIERQERRLPLERINSRLVTVGKRGCVAPLTRALDLLEHAPLEAITQRRQAPFVGQQDVLRPLGGHAKANDPSGVLGPRSQAALLIPAGLRRRKLQALANDQRPPWGRNLCALTLMRSTGAASKSVATLPTHWIASTCTSTSRLRQSAEPLDRKHHARFVVRPHEAHDSYLIVEPSKARLIQGAIARDPDAHDLRPLTLQIGERVEDRRVLDRAADDTRRPLAT